jgi:amicyanin
MQLTRLASVAAVLLIAGVIAFTAVKSVAAAAPAALTVRIDNFTFSPPEITIASGTAVTWENRDDIPHEVVAEDKAFRSKVLDTEESYTFTFTSPGIYEYFCALHPHMKGKVIVK